MSGVRISPGVLSRRVYCPAAFSCAEVKMAEKLSPWAWAVCDPNKRLRNADGDCVDRLICYDYEQAQHILQDAQDAGVAEDEATAKIVELFPLDDLEAVSLTANYWYDQAHQAGYTPDER